MRKLIIKLLTGQQDQAFAVAKAINRKCSVYLFKENFS